MSEEIKKEDQDVELNPEQLKQVSGGFTNHDKCEERFIISEEEMEKMKRGICPVCNKKIESGTDIDIMIVWAHAKNCKG